MGYHRLHTHRGFKTSKLFEYFLAICGTLTLEGGPIFWVAIHRRHHQHSDQPLDPHTPRVSGFWAHIGWILFGEAQHNNTATDVPLRSRPRQRPVLSLADHVSLGAAHRAGLRPARHRRLAAGQLGDFPARGRSACMRPIWSTPPPTSGDAAASRRRTTRKNSWWVAILTFGEGWHNNHHAHPTSARHGLAWYEFDPTWIELKLLRAVGLVWDVKAAKVSQIARGRDRGLIHPFVLCWEACPLADVGDPSPSSSSSAPVSAPACWRSTSAG